MCSPIFGCLSLVFSPLLVHSIAERKFKQVKGVSMSDSSEIVAFYKDVPVLVTGATGFVGGHLTRKLSELGARVTVLVRKTANPHTLAELQDLGVQVEYGDVCDVDSIERAMQGAQIVFHIAALFRQAKFPDSVYFDVNVQGTKNILDVAERQGVDRVVHCSTIGVHSHIPNPPANENEPYRPGDIYQHTKCEGEKVAKECFASGRVKGVVVRPAMIWGEGDRRLLKLFRGVARRKLPVIGNGKTLTHWVYVHDLVQGILLAGCKEQALGQTYIFAGRSAKTMNELYAAVAKAAGVQVLPFKIPATPLQIAGGIMEVLCKPFGIEPPLYRRRVDFYTKHRSFDISKAQNELGYQPANDFETETRNIYEWYKSKNWLS